MPLHGGESHPHTALPLPHDGLHAAHAGDRGDTGGEKNHGARRHAAPAADQEHHGRAVQLDPIKPKLKPPGTKRLEL